MKKCLYSFFALAALLASCTSDNEDIAVDGKSDVKYLLSSKPFEFAEDTRVSFTLDNQNNKLTFAWSYNEKFGVFPTDPSNSQAGWNLNYQCDVTEGDGHSATDTHYAMFDGEGWALQPGVTYAAYQPCQDVLSSVRYDAVPVSLTTNQGGTLAAIGADYDYLYAVGTYEAPKKDGHYSHVIFDFNHAISIVQLSLANAPQGFEFQSASITAGAANFVTGGALNVATGDLVADAHASTINVSGCESDGKTFYVALFPTTTGECTVLVNGRYEFTVASKNLVKGKAYRWTLDFSNAKELVATYTAPTIRTGSSTYNTNAQNLLATSGSAENGTLSYSYRYKTIGGSYGSWSGWSTTAPTGTNAGVYEVKYKVEPATGYTGGVSETSLGEFTINKANQTEIVGTAESPATGTDPTFTVTAKYTANTPINIVSLSGGSGTGAFSVTSGSSCTIPTAVPVMGGMKFTFDTSGSHLTVMTISTSPFALNAGYSHTVVVTKAGDNNYNAQTKEFTIIL